MVLQAWECLLFLNNRDYGGIAAPDDVEGTTHNHVACSAFTIDTSKQTGD